MCLYPDIQRRGQAEIDNAIGDKRLPCLTDRHELPYVNAIVKEVLRWNPAVPLGKYPYMKRRILSHICACVGLPHQLVEEDVYRDFRIPKGSILWANIWYTPCTHRAALAISTNRPGRTILHDETVFPEPGAFRPERYMDSDGTLLDIEREKDPSYLAFGFGRRQVTSKLSRYALEY